MKQGKQIPSLLKKLELKHLPIKLMSWKYTPLKKYPLILDSNWMCFQKN